VKHIILIIIFLLTIFSQRVFAQIDFRFGPELGLSVTTKPENPYFSEMKYTQRLRSQFGVDGLLRINDKVIISSGLQYERTGYYGEYTDSSGSKYVEAIDFQKLCIPLTFGISFKILKLSPSIFVGYRPNIFLSGKKEANNKSFNLYFDGSTTKRYISQFTIGLSAEVIKTLRVKLSCSAGPSLEYSIPYYFSSGPLTGRWGDIGGSFKNSELSLSLTYLFKSKKAAK
jgi:hypothetical protein